MGRAKSGYGRDHAWYSPAISLRSKPLTKLDRYEFRHRFRPLREDIRRGQGAYSAQTVPHTPWPQVTTDTLPQAHKINTWNLQPGNDTLLSLMRVFAGGRERPNRGLGCEEIILIDSWAPSAGGAGFPPPVVSTLEKEHGRTRGAGACLYFRAKL